MSKKMWIYSPKKKSVKVNDSIKALVKSKADNFIVTVLKPKHIKPPPEKTEFNYIVIFTVNGTEITFISAQSIMHQALMQ